LVRYDRGIHHRAQTHGFKPFGGFDYGRAFSAERDHGTVVRLDCRPIQPALDHDNRRLAARGRRTGISIGAPAGSNVAGVRADSFAAGILGFLRAGKDGRDSFDRI